MLVPIDIVGLFALGALALNALGLAWIDRRNARRFSLGATDSASRSRPVAPVTGQTSTGVAGRGVQAPANWPDTTPGGRLPAGQSPGEPKSKPITRPAPRRVMHTHQAVAMFVAWMRAEGASEWYLPEELYEERYLPWCDMHRIIPDNSQVFVATCRAQAGVAYGRHRLKGPAFERILREWGLDRATVMRIASSDEMQRDCGRFDRGGHDDAVADHAGPSLPWPDRLRAAADGRTAGLGAGHGAATGKKTSQKIRLEPGRPAVARAQMRAARAGADDETWADAKRRAA